MCVNLCFIIPHDPILCYVLPEQTHFTSHDGTYVYECIPKACTCMSEKQCVCTQKCTSICKNSALSYSGDSNFLVFTLV